MTAPAGGPTAHPEPVAPGARRRVPPWFVPVVKVVLVVAATWYLLRLLRRVDWGNVAAAVGQLAWWQVLALLGVVGVRQILNAGPLALFTPGLGVRRAVMNDVTANLIGTIAPPPSDIVLRLAMFQSWGISIARATSGLTLNTLAYFGARFAAPTLGFAIALVTDGYYAGYAWTALTSGLVALLIVLGLVAVTRGERAAAALGLLAGRLGHRVLPHRVDPVRWEQMFVTFQSRSGEQLRRSGGWAALDLLGLLLTEGLLLVLCLRFVGVPADQVPAAAVLAILFVSYPLTALPFAGLGVLDTAVAAVLAADESVDTSAVVAALVVWRVCLLLVPLVLGGLCLLLWRRSTPMEVQPEPEPVP